MEEFRRQIGKTIAGSAIFHGWDKEFTTPSNSYKLDELPPELLPIAAEDVIKYREKLAQPKKKPGRKPGQKPPGDQK